MIVPRTRLLRLERALGAPVPDPEHLLRFVHIIRDPGREIDHASAADIGEWQREPQESEPAFLDRVRAAIAAATSGTSAPVYCVLRGPYGAD